MNNIQYYGMTNYFLSFKQNSIKRKTAETVLKEIEIAIKKPENLRTDYDKALIEKLDKSRILLHEVADKIKIKWPKVD